MHTTRSNSLSGRDGGEVYADGARWSAIDYDIPRGLLLSAQPQRRSDRVLDPADVRLLCWMDARRDRAQAFYDSVRHADDFADSQEQAVLGGSVFDDVVFVLA